MNNNGLVTITEAEYDKLQQKELWLECLENNCQFWSEDFSKAELEFDRRLKEIK